MKRALSVICVTFGLASLAMGATAFPPPDIENVTAALHAFPPPDIENVTAAFPPPDIENGI